MKKLTYLLFCLIAGIGWISAQNTRVTGTVLSAEDRGPLPGVTIVEKGNATNGTITDVEGKYTITVPSNATLHFSYIGLESQEIAVSGRQVIDVTLQAGSRALDEVIVVAYGTAKKSSFTGSAGSLKAESI